MTNDDRATAILVNWKRPQNVPRIVDSLRAVEFVDDIVVWDNSGTLRLRGAAEMRWLWCDRGYRVRQDAGFQAASFKIVHSNRNVMLWGRVHAARFAKHRLIATQDDDYIVRNWQALYSEARERSDCIVGNMHLNERFGDVIPCGAGWDIMLGWGSMFRFAWPTDYPRLFWPYMAEHGVDDVLMRDADRVFAVSWGVKHHAVQADVETLADVDTPGIALHKQDGHKEITRAARQRAAAILEAR